MWVGFVNLIECGKYHRDHLQCGYYDGGIGGEKHDGEVYNISWTSLISLTLQKI